jgi:hypothetical protein
MPLAIAISSVAVCLWMRIRNKFLQQKFSQLFRSGGADAVTKGAIAATGVSPTEIHLVSGSGLGEENRMSPLRCSRTVYGNFRTALGKALSLNESRWRNIEKFT